MLNTLSLLAVAAEHTAIVKLVLAGAVLEAIGQPQVSLSLLARPLQSLLAVEVRPQPLAVQTAQTDQIPFLAQSHRLVVAVALTTTSQVVLALVVARAAAVLEALVEQMAVMAIRHLHRHHKVTVVARLMMTTQEAVAVLVLPDKAGRLEHLGKVATVLHLLFQVHL